MYGKQTENKNQIKSDHQVLTSAEKIVDTMKRTGAQEWGRCHYLQKRKL